jgi:uncharacterized protein YjbJ (UPF0337 family)
MGGKAVAVKGRVQEAAGALTGKDQRREEGETGQVAGKVKEAVAMVVDKVRKSMK